MNYENCHFSFLKSTVYVSKRLSFKLLVMYFQATHVIDLGSLLWNSVRLLIMKCKKKLEIQKRYNFQCVLYPTVRQRRVFPVQQPLLSMCVSRSNVFSFLKCTYKAFPKIFKNARFWAQKLTFLRFATLFFNGIFFVFWKMEIKPPI